MVDAGVQIPLDALTQDVGKPGNPPAWGAGERRFKSDHPDLLSRSTTVVRLPVKEKGVGSSPTGTAFFGKTNQLAMVPVLKTGEPRGLVGSTPTLSA